MRSERSADEAAAALDEMRRLLAEVKTLHAVLRLRVNLLESRLAAKLACERVAALVAENAN